MTLLRLLWRYFFPRRHYDLSGANNADLYALMSPGNGIRVKE